VHWDQQAAANGKKALYIKVRFDALLDAGAQEIFPRKKLGKGVLRKMHWDSQRSGIRIPDDVARVLEDQWALFLESQRSHQQARTTRPRVLDFDDVWDSCPLRKGKLQANARKYSGRKTDFSKIEAENKKLGGDGEDFVVALEQYDLRKAGCHKLARRVERVSNKLGDGVGYDVLSFETDGSEKYIEVKTTNHGKQTPFFISANEFEFSIDYSSQAYLYRVFNFSKSPRVFKLKGSIEGQCVMSPQIYHVRF